MQVGVRCSLSWAVLAVGFLLVAVLPTAAQRDYSKMQTPVFDGSTATPATANKADEKSQITWATIPKGSSYKSSATAPVTGIEPFYDLAHSFIGAVLPDIADVMDLVQKAMKGDFSSLTGDIPGLLKKIAPFAVCIIFGFLFMLFMPIVGFCFCCCRCCCKKCGGKMEYKDDGKGCCRRGVCGLFLFIIAAMMASGVICAYVAGGELGKNIKDTFQRAQDNMDDVTVYMNNTYGDLDYLLKKNYNFVKQVFDRDFEDVGAVLGVPTRDAIGNIGVSVVITSMSSLADSLKSISQLLFNVDNSSTAIKTATTNLGAKLTALKSKIDGHMSGCGTSCSSVDTTALNAAAPSQFSGTFPDMTAQLTSMRSATSSDIYTTLQSATDEYNRIPEKVYNKTRTTQTDVKKTMSNFDSNIDDLMTSVTGFIKPPAALNDLKSQLNGLGDISQYDKYREYAGIAFCSFLLIFSVLLIIGVIFGMVGSSASTPAEDRSCVSNSGGQMLMGSVGLMFIFSFLLMLLTTILFVIGAPLEKYLCFTFRDPQMTAVKTLLDKPDGLLGAGYILGSVILQNSSIDLKFSDVITRCKNNTGAVAALKLTSLPGFDFENKIGDYRKTVDVNSTIQQINVDLSNVKIMSPQFRQQMADFKSALDMQTQLDAYKVELGKSVTSGSLSTLQTSLTTAASNARSAGQTAMADNLDADAKEVGDINANEFKAVDTQKTALLTDVNSLNNAIIGVPQKIDDTLINSTIAENNIHAQAQSLLQQQIQVFADRLLGVVDQFLAYTLNQGKFTAAGCQPLYNLWMSVNIMLCRNTIDPLNGFWMGIGWNLFFFIPAIILAIKLSREFRQMKGKGSEYVEPSAPPMMDMACYSVNPPPPLPY